MFNSKLEERIKVLERQVTRLTTILDGVDGEDGVRARLSVVERAVEPYRIGLYDYLTWRNDPRPKVSIKDAISKIMSHLGMDFCVTPAKAAEVHLCKPKRGK